MDAGSKLLLVAACLLAVAVLTSDGRPAKQLIRLKRTSADREKKIEQNDLTPVRREVDGVEARISTRHAAEAALPDRIDAAFRKLLRVKRQDELELTGEDDGSKEGQDDDESGKNDDPDDDQNDEDDYDDDDDDDNNDENENNNDGDDDEEDDNNDDDEDNDDDDDDDDGDDGDYDDEDDDDDDDDDTDEDDFAAHFESEIDSLLDSTDSGVGANDENLLTDPLEDDDEDDDDEDDLIEDEKDKQFDFWDYIMNMFNFGPDWQQQVEEEFDDGFYDDEEDDDGYLLGEGFDPDGHGYSLSEADVDDNEDQLAKVSMEVVGEGKTEKTGDRLKRSIK